MNFFGKVSNYSCGGFDPDLGEPTAKTSTNKATNSRSPSNETKHISPAESAIKSAKAAYSEMRGGNEQDSKAINVVLEQGTNRQKLELGEWFLTRSGASGRNKDEINYAKRLLSSIDGEVKMGFYPEMDRLSSDSAALQKISPFPNNHYEFFSSETSVISGSAALTDDGSEYIQAGSIASVCSAMDGFFTNNHGILKVDVQGNSVTCYHSVMGDNSNPHVANIKNAVAGIFPPDGADKKAVIAFYNQKPVLKFSIYHMAKADATHYTSKQDYELKPVLVYDKENERHYLHFELSKIEDGIQSNQQPNSVMVNFCGNGISQDGQIGTAAQLLQKTGVKQIIPIYPNKGINRLLNPDLKAATTSIKGSVNPHIIAINSLVEQCPDNNVDIQIYAHSYGNLASAKFMERARETTPDKPIFYVGSATASTLLAVAGSFVGGPLAWVADKMNLLHDSDVFAALNHKQTTAIIFNDTDDKIIKADAQIQNHPSYKAAPPKNITIVDMKSYRLEVWEGRKTERIALAKAQGRDVKAEEEEINTTVKNFRAHYDCLKYAKDFDTLYGQKINEYQRKSGVNQNTLSIHQTSHSNNII